MIFPYLSSPLRVILTFVKLGEIIKSKGSDKCKQGHLPQQNMFKDSYFVHRWMAVSPEAKGEGLCGQGFF